MSSFAHTCRASVRNTLDELGISDESGTVLVAVSGGPDSVGLLHLLRDLHVPLEAAHLDHETREGQSAVDALFVGEICEQLGVTLHSESCPVAEGARAASQSFEEYGRRVRYDFFARVARARECSFIATGHHLGDQAETVLMRVLRGTSPRGLAGIPPLGEWNGVPVIRPLIHLTRDEISSYLHELRITYSEDATNRDTRHVRNRVRHELLPLIEAEYNPNVREALCRLAEMCRDEEGYLAERAAAFLIECTLDDGSLDRNLFREGHVTLQRRALLTWCWARGVEPDFERVKTGVELICDGDTGKRADLGKGLLLCNGRTRTTLESTEKDAAAPEGVSVSIPGVTEAFGLHFDSRVLSGPPAAPWSTYCTPTRQVFDGSCFNVAPTLRQYRPGDRFRPMGMTGTKKVSDYLSEAGVPASERSRQVLLDAGGRILWVVGHTISAHAAVHSDTEQIVEIVVRNEA